MASGDQKAIVKRDTLPPVSLLSDETYGYIVRYRIISEDQNRYSQWSPIREISIPSLVDVEGAIAINNSVIQLTWGDDELGRSYDIFVKFDTHDIDQDPVYHGTTDIHTYSLLADPLATTVEVAIQIASADRQYAPGLIIWDTDAPEDLVSLS